MSGTNDHCEPRALQAFLEGDPGAGERRDLAAHLERCPGCRAEERALRSLFGDLEALERQGVPDPGPRFSRRVMAEILRRDTAARVRRNRVIVPAVAAALLALVLAFRLMPSPPLPAVPGAAGGPAVPALVEATLRIVHSGVVLAVEGLDLASRLARTVSSLMTALPVAAWAACLSLLVAVHGVLALCLRQYGRRLPARC